MPHTQIAAALDQILADPAGPDSQAEIAGGIVHDLNNIFSSLAIATHLLQKEMGAERRRSLLAALERATVRGQALLGELTRHGERRDDEEIDLDLQILIEAVARTARSRCGARFSLVTSYEQSLPRITGDPSALFSLFYSMIMEEAVSDRVSIRCRLIQGPRASIGEPPTVEVRVGDPERGTSKAVRLPTARNEDSVEEAPADLCDDSGSTRLLLEHPAY